LLISNNFGDDNYNIIIKGVLNSFRFKLKDFKKKMKISDAIQLCSEKLNSQEFVVSNCYGPDNNDCQNMCNFIPKLYGNEKNRKEILINPRYNFQVLSTMK